jgi:pimeloyl-ACP methyl ester carboxylesterase
MGKQDGPRLVLLHAAGMGRTSWDPAAELIPGFVHTLSIDLPGHAGVPAVAYDRDVVPRLAAFVAEKITSLGLRRPHVVGHSLGGAIALELARQIPVAAVTAMCTIGFRSATHATMCAAKLRATTRFARALGPELRDRLLGKAVFRRMVLASLSARPAALHAGLAAADVTSMVDSDLVTLSRWAAHYSFRTPELADTTPVNLVWAAQDRVVPPSDADRARRVFPRASHLVMPDCGHLVMRDDPDGTAAVIHACHAQVLRAERHIS